MTSFGSAVRARRLELGMTLQEVGDRMSRSLQFVSYIELAPDYTPTSYTIGLFAQVFDTKISVYHERHVSSDGTISTEDIETVIDKPRKKRKV